jgi:F-type H+-transporting ATPase subunit a
MSFLYYNFLGIRAQGFAYAKQFIGDPPAMAPLMIPIEILSHLSRPLSLSIRLFGNIFAEHTLAGVFFILLPFGLPLIFAPLGVFVAFMQTFVFTMLSMVYIAGALEHGH